MMVYDLFLFGIKLIIVTIICYLIAVYVISSLVKSKGKKAVSIISVTILIFCFVFFGTYEEYTELEKQVDQYLENQKKCAEIINSGNCFNCLNESNNN